MSAKKQVASHPAARRMTWFLGAIAALLFACGALEFLGGAIGAGVATTGGAGLIAWFLRWLSRVYSATALHNRATDMILRGDLDGATALLDSIKPTRSAIMQSVALQRAMIALVRGDMKSAENYSTSCIAEGSTGVRVKTATAARSIRAFARASQGNADGAREDIAAVRGSSTPDVVPLARVAVAELTLSAGANDIEGIVRVLSEHERVLEYASPRERALVRGFERMVAQGGSSIYRKPGNRESNESAVGEWGATVVPALRGLMPAQTAQVRAAEEPARPPHQAPPIPKGPSVARRVIALWVVLVIAFIAIWNFLEPSPHHASHASSAETSATFFSSPGVAFSFIFAILLGLIFLNVRRATKNAEKMRVLETRVQLGEDAALVVLDDLTRARQRGTAASAHLVLARAAERRADFRESLRHAEAGLARIEINQAMRNAFSDILVPGLHVERAIAWAAMGRAEEALRGCDALAAAFPGYAYLSTSTFRVRLLAAARASDFERAWNIAQSRATDMSISYRDEFLCALLEAQFKGVGQDELARLSHVLRRNESLRNWIRSVAPGLMEALGFIHDRVAAHVEDSPESIEEEESQAPSSRDLARA